MITPLPYTKKPITIEAVQWDGSIESADAIEIWSGGMTVCCGYDSGNQCISLGIFIKPNEGEMRADPNDWIIKGVKGEFYSCKPDIFEQKYELANINRSC